MPGGPYPHPADDEVQEQEERTRIPVEVTEGRGGRDLGLH